VQEANVRVYEAITVETSNPYYYGLYGDRVKALLLWA